MKRARQHHPSHTCVAALVVNYVETPNGGIFRLALLKAKPLSCEEFLSLCVTLTEGLLEVLIHGHKTRRQHKTRKRAFCHFSA
jgi:hypothetical protein